VQAARPAQAVRPKQEGPQVPAAPRILAERLAKVDRPVPAAPQPRVELPAQAERPPQVAVRGRS
jgi:hypothetical protein